MAVTRAWTWVCSVLGGNEEVVRVGELSRLDLEYSYGFMTRVREAILHGPRISWEISAATSSA